MSLHRTTLRVEELGQRTLPSVTVAQPVPMATAIVHQTTHPMTGTSRGEFAQAAPAPGSSEAYRLSGTAHVAGMGEVRVKGSVHTVGNTRSGTAIGTITLSNARGSVTLRLEGPKQVGFSTLPKYFRYTIVTGTGAYARLKDSGLLRLDLTPGPRVGAIGARGTYSMAI